MAGNILGEARPAFRIRRPLPSNGSASDVDKTIALQLAELDGLLKKQVFAFGEKGRARLFVDAAMAEEEADAAEQDADAAEEMSDAAFESAGTQKGMKRAVKAEKKSAAKAAQQAKAEARAAAALERAAAAARGDSLDPNAVLVSKLTPKFAGEKTKWSRASLAALLSAAKPHEGATTLAGIIDADPELSELSAAFDAAVREDLYTMPEKAQVILGGRYSGIRDYLVALAYFNGIDDVEGLTNFVVNTSRGAATIADYAIVSAARVIVHGKGLNVPDLNDDAGSFVGDVRQRDLSFSAVSFEKGVLALVDKRNLTTHELNVLASTKIGIFPRR